MTLSCSKGKQTSHSSNPKYSVLPLCQLLISGGMRHNFSHSGIKGNVLKTHVKSFFFDKKKGGDISRKRMLSLSALCGAVWKGNV